MHLRSGKALKEMARPTNIGTYASSQTSSEKQFSQASSSTMGVNVSNAMRSTMATPISTKILSTVSTTASAMTQ